MHLRVIVWVSLLCAFVVRNFGHNLRGLFAEQLGEHVVAFTFDFGAFRGSGVAVERRQHNVFVVFRFEGLSRRLCVPILISAR